MAQNKEKIVQAIVQELVGITNLVKDADARAQILKTKWQALNPDLQGTVLTQAQVNTINSWITDLETLKNHAMVAVVQNKSVPSHGTGALG